jgi:hypothetical protein
MFDDREGNMCLHENCVARRVGECRVKNGHAKCRKINILGKDSVITMILG